MSTIDQQARIELSLNAQKATDKLNELTKEAAKLNKELQATEKGTKQYEKLEKQLNAVEKNMRKAEKAAFDVNKVLDNLSGASVNDINKAIKEMTRQMNGMERNSNTWKFYKEQIERAREELKKINNEGKESESWLSRFNNKFAKWGSLVATAVAGFTGLTLTIQKFRQMAMEKESSQANLKALTGLDDQSIAWLTEQAEQLSTTMEKSGLRVRKTSQEILDAYTLVGSAKPELLSNKEALNAVTIEAMRLAEAARMDLTQAVDAVTLSMNQYGASADEAARYTNVMAAGSKFGSAAVQSVTTAVQKAGVAASTAGIPIEALVGSIETLAEKGIKDEVAGTGLKTFFLKLEGMSEDVRPSVVGLQTALENLQAKQMDSVEMLKAFELEAYTVAQAMISGADKVKYYTEAVTGTNVAVEQAAINSQTTEARMAQAHNRIKEVGIELGQRLTPFIISTTKFTTLLMEAFTALIDACAKYKTGLIAMMTTMTALIALKKLDVIWSKAQAIATAGASAALKVFNAVIKANPIGLAITAAAALVGVIAQLADKVNFAKDSQERLNNSMQESQQASISEIRKLSELKGELSALKKGTKEYDDVKQQIINGYSKYYDGLAEELDKVGLTAAAYDKLTEAITNTYNARQYKKFSEEQQQALDEELSSVLDKIYDRTIDKLGAEKGAAAFAKIRDAILQGTITSVARSGGYGTELRGVDSSIQGYLDEMSGVKDGDFIINRKTERLINDAVWLLNDFKEADRQAKEKFGVIENEIKDIKKESEATTTPKVTNTSSLPTTSPSSDNEERNKKNQDKLSIIEANLNAQLALEETAFLTGQKTEKEHLDTVKKLNEYAIEEKQKLYKKDSKEWAALESEKTVKLQKYEQDMFRIKKKYEEDIQTFAAKYQEKSLEDKKNYELEMWDELYKEKAEKDELYYQIRNEIIKKYDKLAEEEKDKEKRKQEKEQKEQLAKLKENLNPNIYNLVDKGIIDDSKAGDINRYLDGKGDTGDESSSGLLQSLLPNLKVYEQSKQKLDELFQQGLISQTEYAEGLAELQKDNFAGILEDIAKITQQAWSQISALMNAGSELMQANMDLEIAKINQRYDVQLQRAEGNEEETKKLEEKKEAEIARVKNEYNKRQMKMQMAQTISTSIIAALNAWASAMNPAYAPYNLVIGGVLSGIIAAQTAIQIAALKKQHEAQAAGYYSGGYTYRTLRDTDPAGIVHGNEFVVNARAVRNPAIRPMLDFIDTAQRNNYISSITSSDVARAAGAVPATTTVINNNSDSETLAQVVSVVAKLSKQLDQPIVAQTYVTGKGGSLEANKLYDKMISNATK